MRLIAKMLTRLVLVLALLLAGPALATITGVADLGKSWRTASREGAKLAPDPATTQEAVIQVYGARAFGWRGAFAVHTWIAAKREGAPGYRTYQVIGWNQWRGGLALTVRDDIPDRRWYGSLPTVYRDIRGSEAAALIDKLEAAVEAYPYADQYRVWPGPNSNTFTAWVAREVPELRIDLPPTAIGKDYLGPTKFLASAPSGTGFQLSLLGVLGVTAGLEEGLEVNILSLGFGVDPKDLTLRLPGIGRLP